MSNKLRPTDWQTQSRIFEAAGFKLVRQTSSHLLYERDDCLRPITIPKYSEIGLDIIRRNMKTAGLDREDYLKLLKKV